MILLSDDFGEEIESGSGTQQEPPEMISQESTPEPEVKAAGRQKRAFLDCSPGRKRQKKAIIAICVVVILISISLIAIKGGKSPESVREDEIVSNLPEPSSAVETPTESATDSFTENDGFDYASSAEEPESAPVENSVEESKETVFDYEKLQNWNDQAFQEAYEVSDIYSFVPKNPKPMQYIVFAKPVIDPVTMEESEGGYNKETARHLPISTEDLLRCSGELYDGGLTLTDDPDQATFALILSYSYENNIGTFHFNEDNTTVPQYHATLIGELLNLVSGESVFSETKDIYATYANESVRTSMLDAAKGKQLYGGTTRLYADDFYEYWDFVRE